MEICGETKLLMLMVGGNCTPLPWGKRKKSFEKGTLAAEGGGSIGRAKKKKGVSAPRLLAPPVLREGEKPMAEKSAPHLMKKEKKKGKWCGGETRQCVVKRRNSPRAHRARKKIVKESRGEKKRRPTPIFA